MIQPKINANHCKPIYYAYMEWYSGMALLITLVWLYLEILRLLGKVQSRR
jgi:uncharacterized YccA/Bax inhibitor family protein